jgi:hypothetical protein
MSLTVTALQLIIQVVRREYGSHQTQQRDRSSLTDLSMLVMH